MRRVLCSKIRSERLLQFRREAVEIDALPFNPGTQLIRTAECLDGPGGKINRKQFKDGDRHVTVVVRVRVTDIERLACIIAAALGTGYGIDSSVIPKLVKFSVRIFVQSLEVACQYVIRSRGVLCAPKYPHAARIKFFVIKLRTFYA
jgi:hypothetical protein